MSKIKSLGTVILSIVIFIALIFLAMVLITGGLGIALKINHILIRATTICTLICVFIFLTLALLKKTRIISVYGLFISSFVFGLSLWIYGFLVTYIFWGVSGVIFGTLLAAIGVVPL